MKKLLITWQGQTHDLTTWSKITGIPRKTLSRRYQYGWTVEQMLTTPVSWIKGVRLTYQGKQLTLTQWAVETGLRLATIRARLARGWSIDKALSHPVRLYTTP